MDFLTLIEILEGAELLRGSVASNTSDAILSYSTSDNSTFSIEINEETINNIRQICLKIKNSEVYLYVNHSTRRNLTKFSIASIETIVIQ